MNFITRWWKPREPEPSTAPVARERLQVLLSHERGKTGQSNLLSLIKEDVLAAIKRHIAVPEEAVHVKVERRKAVSTMRISLDLPK
ncbi:MAG: cell division topological specificity factor MinE [Rhizobiales bacterium]|nr:cell division topological specificity factor MinE [Hyphomicrobiales bacterium]